MREADDKTIRPGQKTTEVLAALGGAAFTVHRRAESLAGRRWWQAPVTFLGWKMAASDYRRAADRITSDGWDTLAMRVVDERLRRHFDQHEGGRNPFHPRVLAELDAVADIATTDEFDENYQVTDATRHAPELAARFARPEVVRLVLGEVERLQAVARSTVMLVEHQTDEREREVLVVQHQASGLRARFTRGRNGVGTVFAKPYSITSIDPSQPEDDEHRAPDWWVYVGLGVGRRIYDHAATLLPEERWRAGTQTGAAMALRGRLHTKDPWRWQSRDCSCFAMWDAFSNPAEASVATHAST